MEAVLLILNMTHLHTYLVLFFCAFAPLLTAQTDAKIDKACEQILPRVIEWRRYLHQYPELSNRETKTAAYIEAHLRKLGLEVRTQVAKTGVVAILKGGKTRSSDRT